MKKRKNTPKLKKLSKYLSISPMGIYVIERPVYKDERGFFHEMFRLEDLEKAGIKFKPLQFNHSRSFPKVIRAIHTENWQKVIYPFCGHMFAAIVDARPSSQTFGLVEEYTFNRSKPSSKFKALYLPSGVGNSICVVGANPVEYFYATAEYWDDKKAKGIAWNDPDLKINWPINTPIISDRDRKNPTLRELYPGKFKKR
jgi:dTDP-4-dehydrorhamnose 3,5-epimerase